MAKSRDVKTLQKFAAAHASIHNHFNQDRHLNRRDILERANSAASKPVHVSLIAPVRVVTSPRRVSGADDARENGPSWRYAEGRRLDPAGGYFVVAMKTPSQSVPGGSRS